MSDAPTAGQPARCRHRRSLIGMVVCRHRQPLGERTVIHYRPSPKSQSSGLIERLSQSSEDDVANEVMLLRLEQDARRLMSADIVGAHTVLGGVASLRWDVDLVHDHFRIALQHLDTAETNYNYSVALSNVEERQAAFEAGATAQRRIPDDRFLIDHAIRLAIAAGHFAEGRRLCERWNALVPDETHAMTPRLAGLAAAANANLFSERAVQRLLAIMSTLQRGERVRGLTSAMWEDPREARSFLYEQLVDATPAEAGRLNVKFVDEVVSHPDLMEDPGFRFVPMFIGARV